MSDVSTVATDGPEEATFAASTAERDVVAVAHDVDTDVSDAVAVVDDVKDHDVTGVLESLPKDESDIAKTVADIHAMVSDIHGLVSKAVPFVEEVIPQAKTLFEEIEKGGIGALFSLFTPKA